MQRVSRRNFLARGAVGAAAIAVGGGVLTACGNDDDSGAQAGSSTTRPETSTTSKEPIVIRVTESTSGLSGFNSAIDRDFLKDLGAEVEGVSVSAADQAFAIQQGRVNVAPIGFMQMPLQLDQGIELIAHTAPTGSHSSVFVASDNSAASLTDMKGARLGLLPRSSAQFIDLRQVAALEGLDLEKDFSLTFGDAPTMEGLFKQGDLDAFATFEPNSSRLIVMQEAKELVGMNAVWREEYGVNLPAIVRASNAEWATENPEASELLREAEAARVEALGGSTELFELYAEEYLFTGLPESVDRQLFLDTFIPRYRSMLLSDGWSDATIESMQARLDSALDLGILPKAFDAEQFVAEGAL